MKIQLIWKIVFMLKMLLLEWFLQLEEPQLKIYYSDLDKEYTTAEVQHYASRWKANGNGVDINRNFSAGWDKVTHRMEPSAQLYQGQIPFSSAEAKALRDYTMQYLIKILYIKLHLLK